MSRPTLVVAAAFALILAIGCQPQLGQCDEPEAMTLVMDAIGYPAYAGQAMVDQACSSCHGARVTGTRRRGAPAHLNFDAVGSQTDDPMTPDVRAIDRLVASQLTIFDNRFAMFRTVETGSMPPGQAGLLAFRDEGYTYLGSGQPLPSIISADGIEIYRTWLACGAPMVTQSAEPGDSDPAGASCGGTPPTLSDEDHCYYRAVVAPIDPTWTAIYDEIIYRKCVSCHGPTRPAVVTQSALDLSDKDQAYVAMVGVAAMGEPCGPDGAADRIIPGDADGSMLIHKLEDTLPDGRDVCGDLMPSGVLLPASRIAVIRQWIDDGAMDN